MRYGLVADVHGNLHALRATLLVLESQSVDAVVFAGDLVGYGPFPNECVELIAGLNAIGVAGNHDLIALGRLPDERCIPLARQSLSWTRSVLVEESRHFLSTLPLVTEAAGGVMVAHGSLDDPQEYTVTAERAVQQLDQLPLDSSTAEILVLGHTHRPWCYGRAGGAMKVVAGSPIPLPPGQRYLLNPGSVGQSREFRNHARFAVLDLDERLVEFHRVAYDFSACRRALRRQGLPRHSCHLRPSPVRRGRRLLRTVKNHLVRARRRHER